MHVKSGMLIIAMANIAIKARMCTAYNMSSIHRNNGKIVTLSKDEMLSAGMFLTDILHKFGPLGEAIFINNTANIKEEAKDILDSLSRDEKDVPDFNLAIDRTDSKGALNELKAALQCLVDT